MSPIGPPSDSVNATTLWFLAFSKIPSSTTRAICYRLLYGSTVIEFAVLVTLTQLRFRGRRLSSHDMANARRIQGVVQLSRVDFPRFGVLETLEFRRRDSVLPDAVMARVFEPRLVGWREHLILLRGYEPIGESDERFSVVQEWRLELTCMPLI